MNVVPLERCFGSPGNIESQRQHGGSVTSPRVSIRAYFMGFPFGSTTSVRRRKAIDLICTFPRNSTILMLWTLPTMQPYAH